MPDSIRNRNRMIKKAYMYARNGNLTMAQGCFDAARRFHPVTDNQTNALNALMNNNFKTSLYTGHLTYA